MGSRTGWTAGGLVASQPREGSTDLAFRLDANPPGRSSTLHVAHINYCTGAGGRLGQKRSYVADVSCHSYTASWRKSALN